jgi:hypothetical protein
MNAICERLAGTVRREIPGRSPMPGEAHLRAVLAEYQEHYTFHPPHRQGGLALDIVAGRDRHSHDRVGAQSTHIGFGQRQAVRLVVTPIPAGEPLVECVPDAETEP